MIDQEKIKLLEQKVDAYMERGLELQAKVNELEKERTDLYIFIGKQSYKEIIKDIGWSK